MLSSISKFAVVIVVKKFKHGHAVSVKSPGVELEHETCSTQDLISFMSLVQAHS